MGFKRCKECEIVRKDPQGLDVLRVAAVGGLAVLRRVAELELGVVRLWAVRVSVFGCVRVRVRVHVCACVCLSARARVWVCCLGARVRVSLCVGARAYVSVMCWGSVRVLCA